MLRHLATAASVLALAVGTILITPGTAAAATFNVRDFGATGNGNSNDTPAIQRAIDAAAEDGGGTVLFPPGTYQSRNTIHLRSNITMRVDAGATIMGAGNDDYDPPEPNRWDDFQDFGHSHFHNSMIFGDRVRNVEFVGAGVIDGGGHLITGNPDPGEADKIITLTRCDGLRVGDGLTLRRGGHFAMLINGCTNVTSDRLRIDTASDRDGWNVISTTNVRITNANIAANDDALAFKSDYALGAKLPNGNVTVTDSRLSAVCCNALMFGSETCGDFTGYDFQRISINGANKSGLGMVSMDGTVISDVHYRDITMTNVRSAIMQKIGTRRRCGNNPGIGRIHDVTYENIRSTGQSSANFTATMWGESGSNNKISNVTFDNVDLTVPGGSTSTSVSVPSNDPNNYNPNSIGTRPAYGWYLRNVNGVRFTDSSVQFAAGDTRAAVIANTSANVVFDRFTAERSTGPRDLLFQTVAGFCVRDSGALRVSQTDSTDSCPAPALALENGLARTPPMGFNNWNFTHCDPAFNETTIKRVADSFVSLGLRDAGYTYVNIDDCWALPQRDAQGNLVPDPARFPSGIKGLADYVHARGLKFGIYTSAGTKTCNSAGFPGGLGHERQDANLFASWGVDYLKYDNCNNQGVDAIQRYTTMRDALLATGRPIVYSITEWGSTTPKVWTWGAPVGNLWRTTGDISDNWSSMIGKVHTNDDLAQYAGPGHWNDPDMLEVGNGGMTDTEYRTHFSLWAMMSAPLLMGSNVANLSQANLNILRNTDLITLDQDPLGRQATIVSSSSGRVVYTKPLSNGDFAVALLNKTGAAATVSTTAAAIGLPGGTSFTLKDLWSKQTRTTSSAISASVPAHGTVVYRVTREGGTPPAAGTSQLSDLTTLSATNGWGPVEKNRSNGERAAGDGRTITIGGVTYQKGLGAHAHSSITYRLGGRCSSVSADVGIDDESGDNGGVVFQIWRDGVKVADSGRVTGSQGARRLTADVTGATTLLLAIVDGGDGINHDHADWANPQVTCSAS